MFKKKTLWILLFLVILVVAGGVYYYTTRGVSAEAAESDDPDMQTAVARRGDLILFASGAGQLVPASEIGLGFDESGTLIELNVSVGDKVVAGEVLARLQTKDSPESIEASIAEAELTVVKAEQELDDLYATAEIARTNALNDIALYAQAVRDAQFQLENYTTPLNLQAMETVEALDQMKKELDAASEAFEPYKYLSSSNDTRQGLLEVLNEAQSNYDAAVKRLDYEYELEVAQANLEQARQEYDQYKNGPAPDDLALAEAELANAKAKLTLALEAQAIVELIAPMDGTVLVVDANVGEVMGTTPIIAVADMEQPLLEVYLDETDLDKIAVGYKADVVFDALPNETFSGQVISVDPGLEEVSGVQAVKVSVSLDTENLDPKMVFPVGMNASVDIIAGRAENAVLVPVEALRELGPGEYSVFVVENGEPSMRIVEIGLQDITSAQILSGLEEGEVVTTGIVQTE